MTTGRIVTTARHYKRPPKKRKAVTIAGPAVVRKRDRTTAATTREDHLTPANDDRKPPSPGARTRRSSLRPAASGRGCCVPSRQHSPTTPRQTPRCAHGSSVRTGAGQRDDSAPGTEASLAQLRQRPAADRRRASRSLRSPRGSCASNATAAARCRWSIRCTQRRPTWRSAPSSTGCATTAAAGWQAELLTGIEGVSSRPVRQDRADRRLRRVPGRKAGRHQVIPRDGPSLHRGNERTRKGPDALRLPSHSSRNGS
jgi:hypothetical protein